MFKYAQEPPEALYVAEYDEHLKCITSNAAEYSMVALNSLPRYHTPTKAPRGMLSFWDQNIRTPDASSGMLIMMQNGQMEVSMGSA